MRLIIMFVAIALAAGAFIITMNLTSGNKEPNIPVAVPQVAHQEVPTVDIYTAKKEISVGAIIKQDMLDIQPWPKHLELPDMVPATGQPSEVIGMVARTPFVKGEPIIMTKLANDKDPSFLAAALPKGMRVATIGVDAISGVGGFVFPGDRVDVLITHDIPAVKKNSDAKTETGAQQTPPKDDPITEVLLSNIRVMAVNTKSMAHGGEPPIVPNNVSLEVSATDAQKLRLADSGHGRLSLALRSLKDDQETELARPTGMGDLSRLTPPAYFSVLYDSNGQANYIPKITSTAEGPAGANAEPGSPDDGDDKLSVTVVRGVKAEAVEVSRP
jgi:pilus assembly protein CpaB